MREKIKAPFQKRKVNPNKKRQMTLKRRLFGEFKANKCTFSDFPFLSLAVKICIWNVKAVSS